MRDFISFLKDGRLCQGSEKQAALHEREPVESGLRPRSGGGFVLDSGECRFAGQGGLFPSTEPVESTPGQIPGRSSNTSAPDALDGSPEPK